MVDRRSYRFGFHRLGLTVEDERRSLEALAWAAEQVRVVDVVAERRAAWSDLAGERKVDLRADLCESLPAMVTPGRLDQVLDNLLANALEASPPGGCSIAGSWSADSIELHVVDQGPGLSAPDRERAFDRFWRGVSNRTSQGGGLGLAIAHQLVLADGGSIELRPAAGGGLDVVVPVPPAGGQLAPPSGRSTG